ncbi:MULTISPECIES: type II secretion system protein GspM [unclassified Pseudomonas]|jgi:general secretion pathway protein M|uniref:type II secretion system protein GspM n=1 Tax=unclassified Pseudomonas TaxID=196821 RepID=UPI001F4F908F|nr:MULTISPECIES: type II secretion system protein GspM [unclassified Pseudomonas]
MKLSGLSTIAAKFQRLSLRERRLLLALGVLVVGVPAYLLIWQPTQQRLATAERRYQQQWTLAAQLQQAQPLGVAQSANQPLSRRISDSATAAGLELHQMDSDNDQLRLTLSGDAMALLPWLDRLERDGSTLQSLTLEARDGLLEARVVLR